MQIHLKSICASTACLLLLPAFGSAQELSVEQILDRLYGIQNVQRVPDSSDQVWINDGGAARARAKFTANPNGRFGSPPDRAPPGSRCSRSRGAASASMSQEVANCRIPPSSASSSGYFRISPSVVARGAVGQPITVTVWTTRSLIE